eukprot:1103709-Prorocentrum_minimum.AAC.1
MAQHPGLNGTLPPPTEPTIPDPTLHLQKTDHSLSHPNGVISTDLVSAISVKPLSTCPKYPNT